MKKKFTLMMLLLLIFSSATFGQATASLATVTTAIPGETVSVPLMVTDFNNVGSIQFAITLDAEILSFGSITNTHVDFVNPVVNPVGNTLWITWTDVDLSFPTFNGKLCDINFVYSGPGTSPLDFYPSDCEVSQGFPPSPVIVEYTNGSVSEDPSSPSTVTLVGATVLTGHYVTVQVRFENFTENAGSITQNIHYDVDKLDFVNAMGMDAFVGLIGNASGGIVHLTWENDAGADINWSPATPNAILVTFLYTGNTEADLEFYPGCIVTTADDPPINIEASYHNGTVEPGVAVASASLGPIADAEQGVEYDIPLSLSGFDALGTGTAGAITLNIPFDIPELTYIGTPLNPHSALVNATGTGISIVWTNPAPGLIDGEFLTLRFKYNGPGDANIVFGAGCLFSTVAGDPIQVSYTNGVITQGGSSNAYIGMPTSEVGADIAVPVYFTDMPANVGAVTLNISYDASRLTYLNVSDFPGVGAANFNMTGNVIRIVWTSSTPWTGISTETFCNLNFHVNGGGQAPIAFVAGCEIATNDMPDPVIVPTAWNDGGVNLVYKISGYLTYDNDLNTPLQGITVYLKQGDNPYPDTIPMPVIVTSSITDANGYFEMYAPNGTYWLDGDKDFPLWSTDWVNVGDIINVQKYVAGVAPNTIGPITPTPPWTLRQKAANVYRNDEINGGDIIVLQKRVAGVLPNPNYTAGDMTFENPAIIIDSAPVVQDLKGISTGDVNGSYDPD